MADVNLTHTGAELDAAIAAVLADYADVSGVTAAAADVMTGKIFVDASGEEVAGTNDGSGDTSDATANAGRILAPYTAYVAAGKVTGAMPNNAGDVAAVSYHADGTSLHIVPAEGYTDGTDDAVVLTDADFVAANIKSGVTLFGKEGSMEGGSANSIVITEVDVNKRITEVDVSSFTEIYPYQFWNYDTLNGAYRYLVDVLFSTELTAIGNYAFYYNGNLEITTLPSELETIGSYAFQNCAKITLTSLPSGIISIGTSAFRNCTQLALTSLPEGLTSIETYTFTFCTHIVLTSLPSGIISIGANAFSSCTLLNLTDLPSGLESIGSSAFSACTTLRKIWISSSCITITASAYNSAPFYQCNSALVLYCEAASKPAGWGTYWNYYGSGLQLTVNWGVTKEAFDAL